MRQHINTRTNQYHNSCYVVYIYFATKTPEKKVKKHRK